MCRCVLCVGVCVCVCVCVCVKNKLTTTRLYCSVLTFVS